MRVTLRPDARGQLGRLGNDFDTPSTGSLTDNNPLSVTGILIDRTRIVTDLYASITAQKCGVIRIMCVTKFSDRQLRDCFGNNLKGGLVDFWKA